MEAKRGRAESMCSPQHRHCCDSTSLPPGLSAGTGTPALSPQRVSPAQGVLPSPWGPCPAPGGPACLTPCSMGTGQDRATFPAPLPAPKLPDKTPEGGTDHPAQRAKTPFLTRSWLCWLTGHLSAHLATGRASCSVPARGGFTQSCHQQCVLICPTLVPQDS